MTQVNCHKSRSLRFGEQQISPAPAHVPAKFKEVWQTLPGCCRNFYLNPGAGCCAGLPEPKPKMMEQVHDVQAVSQASTAAKTSQSGNAGAQLSSAQPKGMIQSVLLHIQKVFTGIALWFKRFFTGMGQDLKLLLKGPGA